MYLEVAIGKQQKKYRDKNFLYRIYNNWANFEDLIYFLWFGFFV